MIQRPKERSRSPRQNNIRNSVFSAEGDIQEADPTLEDGKEDLNQNKTDQGLQDFIHGLQGPVLDGQKQLYI